MSTATSLGLELWTCPRKQPGIAAPAVLLAFGALLGSLSFSLLTGSASGTSGDVSFVLVLTLLCVVPGVLLVWRRHSRMKERLVHRVFEGALVREASGARSEIPLGDITNVVEGVGPSGSYTVTVVTKRGPVVLDSNVVDNVDAVMAKALRDACRGVRTPMPTATAPADVEFRPVPVPLNGSYGAPLLGPGTVEARAEGLRLVGARSLELLAQAIGGVTGVLGLVGAAIGLTAFDVEGLGGKALFMVGLVFGILPGVLVYDALQKRLRGKRIDVVLPWGAVRVFESAGAQVVRLMDFDLRGDVVLAPRGDLSAILAALGTRAR